MGHTYPPNPPSERIYFLLSCENILPRVYRSDLWGLSMSTGFSHAYPAKYTKEKCPNSNAVTWENIGFFMYIVLKVSLRAAGEFLP